jgi:arginyl-tRNA synthetase
MSKKLFSKKPSWFTQSEFREVVFSGWKRFCQKNGLDEGVVEKSDLNLEPPADSSFGDYSSNLAMAVFSRIKDRAGVKTPFELAGKIVDEIDKINMIDRIEIVQPGFINLWLSEKYLVKKASLYIDKTSFEKKMAKAGKGKVVVIDYSAPNIAKPFGIGHLRSTTIGQAIYNLYSFLGWKTIGDNHLGDWGTQFGKLIVAIKNWWDKDFSLLTIADLEKLYVRFHQEAEKDPDLDDQARNWFKKLEQGNSEAKKIWQWCIDVSLEEFNRVYDLLSVKIDYAYGESFYVGESRMKKVVADAKKKGVLKKSQGALVVDIGQKVPAMLIKSDGASTYLLRDLATIAFRKKTWNPDLLIYEVGMDQKLHFDQVFKTAKKLGYFDINNMVHVAHGMFRWKDAKFSTRKGKTIHLEEVLNESISRAKKIVNQSGTSKGLSDKEKIEIAKIVGIAGVKFNDLKQEPEKDIVFDWDKVLSLEGYSASYLQYTYARAMSVLRKAEIKPKSESKFPDVDLEKEELELLRFFDRFPETVFSATEKFSPHLVCQYLFTLAQKFNLFYQKCRIIDEQEISDRQSFRLFLTVTTAEILEKGLSLLGIDVLEKM